MRRPVLLAVALVVAVPVLPSRAANVGGGDEVIVAVVDTGIRSTHQEFDYQGPSSTTDQIVAWWDFARTPVALPTAGQTWDMRAPDPSDGCGHGTATASMAVGRNIGATKARSFAPGFKLAVAKVGTDACAVSGSVTAAVRWAVDTVKADVISISIGGQLPFPGIIDDGGLAAIRHARDAGVLVVVSNGNGYANAGVPGDLGWANVYGMSKNVLTVGASGTSGVQASTDPEVAALWNPFMACKAADDCYGRQTGTSFSAPMVAGMAAGAMATAIANGRPATPDAIETLLKYSARDTIMPPQTEGYGVLDAAQFDGVVTPNAAAGTVPARPSPDVNGAHADAIETLRGAWSELSNQSFVPLGVDPGTAAGEIGPSSPGILEGELYTLTLSPGETATITMDYAPPTVVNDVDLYLYARAPLSGVTEELRSANFGGEQESISFTSPNGGTYTVFLAGWSVAPSQGIVVESSSDDVSTPELSFVGQDTFAYTSPLL